MDGHRHRHWSSWASPSCCWRRSSWSSSGRSTRSSHPGRRRTEPRRRVPGLLPHRGRALRHVRLPQLLHAGRPPLFGVQGRGGLPAVRRRGHRGRGGLYGHLVPRIGPRVPMASGLLGQGRIGLAWLTQIGVATSYWTHVLPPEILMSVGSGLPSPLSAALRWSASATRIPAWPVHWSTRPSRWVDRSGLRFSIPWPPRRRPATSLPTGRSLPRAGLVHGYGVAFGVGAAFLLLAAVVSAVFVTGAGVRGGDARSRAGRRVRSRRDRARRLGSRAAGCAQFRTTVTLDTFWSHEA